MLYPSSTTFPGILYPNTSTDVDGTYFFRTPIIQRRMPVIPPLTALINYSVAVLRINGEWVETEWPTEEQIDAADYYFPGGRENIVDGTTALVLQAAGYTLESTNDVPPAPVTPPSSDSTAIVGTALVGTATVG